VDLLPKAKYHIEVKANEDGYVSHIEAEKIGIAAMLLGAGRKTKEDSIDFAAGITLNKKVGDKVKVGEAICTLHTNLEVCEDAKKVAEEAFYISDKCNTIQYIHDIVM